MARVELKGVFKSYDDEGGKVQVLKGIDLKVKEGELVVIMGPSGCGKTTLLNLIAGIDHPDKGSVKVAGKELTNMGEKRLGDYRKNNVGYIFQFFNLIPTLTALENVELALQIKGVKDLAKAKDMLEKVGLGDKLNRFPSQLSGGEQQRVAIARAMAKSPLIVVGDEPTGNLDLKTSMEILDLIKEMNKVSNTTFVLATHDGSYKKVASLVVEIKGGRIV
jgi:putative ABC transport system ATP-binding protein